MPDVIEISCDESGHTGPDLLDVEQRYFSYASVSVGDDEAWEIIEKARQTYPVQMPELKGAKLMKTGIGRALIKELIDALDGRFAVNVHDKLLALCGWVFEYIYEPVYQADPRLLYEKNLHRFVAMFTWLWFNEVGAEAKEAIRQFQRYMRSRDETHAPLLFNQIQTPLGESGSEKPFDLIRRFASGYREIIVADNARLSTAIPDGGRWVLDLSASALWSHLNHWGKQGRPLHVRCDVSKPLQAIVRTFTGDQDDPAIRRARLMGNTEPLGWKLSKPIAFVDSRDCPAVQLADAIAGAAVFLLSKPAPNKSDAMIESIQRHILRDTILPDYDVIDLDQREPAVNYLMLYDLAQRAMKGADPYEDLAETYHAAEVGWASGKFKLDLGE